MERCLQLAALGAGKVAPNPMVGAVLVYNDIIIGEGYHQQYGQAHAEVNCLNSVSEENKVLIEKSTLYVSLEPCSHFGKTPPCADLIIQNRIPAVVIGCLDSYAEVNGKGVQKLQAAGVQVTTGILETEAKKINKRFFTFHRFKRPYIILKWAQSSDKKIAQKDFSAVAISNELTNRLVHKWRSEEAAIMVGTNTALQDNPSLTTRLWPGKSPVRIVIDKDLKIPASAHLLDGTVKTIVFNDQIENNEGNTIYCRLSGLTSLPGQVLEKLFQLQIQSVIIEGGTQLLQSFIDEGCWDEARVITNTEITIGEGIPAPVLQQHRSVHQETFQTDSVDFYYNPVTSC